MKPNALCIYESRPFGSNYTPRDLMLTHAKENPHLFRRAYDHYGKLRLVFQGHTYQYDHWAIHPQPAAKQEHITLFLTEIREEN